MQGNPLTTDVTCCPCVASVSRRPACQPFAGPKRPSWQVGRNVYRLDFTVCSRPPRAIALAHPPLPSHGQTVHLSCSFWRIRSGGRPGHLSARMEPRTVVRRFTADRRRDFWKLWQPAHVQAAHVVLRQFYLGGFAGGPGLVEAKAGECGAAPGHRGCALCIGARTARTHPFPRRI